MKKKIYVLQWSYNHRGEFDCDFEVYPNKEDALYNLKSYYKQAISNITPNNSEKELDIKDYNEEEVNNCHGYYYVERYAADSWERGEIVEKTIEVQVEQNKEEDLSEVSIWPCGYTDEELVGYEVVLWPDSQDLMELDGFWENSYLINDEDGLEKFGSSAFVVDKSWLEKQDCEEITKY